VWALTDHPFVRFTMYQEQLPSKLVNTLVPFLAVHVIGSLLGAKDFPASSLYCHFAVAARGPHWTLLSGSMEGETHIVEGVRRASTVVHTGSQWLPPGPLTGTAGAQGRTRTQVLP
jgi:hypothetical protein